MTGEEVFDRETADIPIGALRRAREGREKDKVIDVSSDNDEPEITSVKETEAVSKLKKMPLIKKKKWRTVPGVIWRTLLNQGKIKKLIEEESTSSDEKFDKSEPDNLDGDMMIITGDRQELYNAMKTKIMPPCPTAKKLKSDNLDEPNINGEKAAARVGTASCQQQLSSNPNYTADSAGENAIGVSSHDIAMSQIVGSKSQCLLNTQENRRIKKEVQEETKKWISEEEIIDVMPLRMMLSGEEDVISFNQIESESI